jgi:perosamine synthetase
MPERFIPYGRQLIGDDDIQIVVDVLRSDWLTTGPMVGQFEEAFARYVGAAHAVAVSNGTAALHLAMLAAGVGPGDEVIVPALTFAASANCVRYAGGTVVFADVRDDTLTIDASQVESLITPRTKAIVAVDYAGLPCDLDELLRICDTRGLLLVEDACHAPGAEYRGRRVGTIAHLTAFSFHPVKHVTTAEGGMVTTGDAALASRVRSLRNHGIATDHRQRELEGTWRYDMTELGFNYRLPDVLCALGVSQLRKLPDWLERRRALAIRYGVLLAGVPDLRLPAEPSDRRHAWHLYAVRTTGRDAADRRQKLYTALRTAGIGANVHYLPVYLHSYYQSLGYRQSLCPVSEAAYDGLLSIPMYPGLSNEDQDRVVAVLSRQAAR